MLFVEQTTSSMMTLVVQNAKKYCCQRSNPVIYWPGWYAVESLILRQRSACSSPTTHRNNAVKPEAFIAAVRWKHSSHPAVWPSSVIECILNSIVWPSSVIECILDSTAYFAEHPGFDWNWREPQSRVHLHWARKPELPPESLALVGSDVGCFSSLISKSSFSFFSPAERKAEVDCRKDHQNKVITTENPYIARHTNIRRPEYPYQSLAAELVNGLKWSQQCWYLRLRCWLWCQRRHAGLFTSHLHRQRNNRQQGYKPKLSVLKKM